MPQGLRVRLPLGPFSIIMMTSYSAHLTYRGIKTAYTALRRSSTPFNLSSFVWSWAHCATRYQRNDNVPCIDGVGGHNTFIVVYHQPGRDAYNEWWDSLEVAARHLEPHKRWRIVPVSDLLGFAYRSTFGCEVFGFRKRTRDNWTIWARNVKMNCPTLERLRESGYHGGVIFRTEKTVLTYTNHSFRDLAHCVFVNEIGHSYEGREW